MIWDSFESNAFSALAVPTLSKLFAQKARTEAVITKKTILQAVNQWREKHTVWVYVNFFKKLL